ncbi:hypothetical protein E4U19_004303 [Claviceps sp. Clav32 group G5]|nr:hypothetical protein E4U19_004303 [Claviceps sp. Clav32 group G5]
MTIEDNVFEKWDRYQGQVSTHQVVSRLGRSWEKAPKQEVENSAWHANPPRKLFESTAKHSAQNG